MIVHLELEDFRGVKQGTIAPLEPLTVLVGLNGCGKTTVLRALESAGEQAPSSWHRQSPGECVRAVSAKGNLRTLTAGGGYRRHVRGRCWELGSNFLYQVKGPQIWEGKDPIFYSPWCFPVLSRLPGCAAEIVPDKWVAERLPYGRVENGVLRSALTDCWDPWNCPEDCAYGGYGRGRFGIGESGKRTPLGDGQHQWAELCLALSPAMGKRLILLDLPETGLHPKLIPELVVMIKEAVGRGSQVVLATHSKELAEGLGGKRLLLSLEAGVLKGLWLSCNGVPCL